MSDRLLLLKPDCRTGVAVLGGNCPRGIVVPRWWGGGGGNFPGVIVVGGNCLLGVIVLGGGGGGNCPRDIILRG